MQTPEYDLLNRTSSAPSIHAANLPVVSEQDASLQVRALYDHFRARFNRPHVPGILQCFATHPPLLEHMMALAETMLFSDGALGRQHKELLATFVSSANQCVYCADSHGYFLRVHGGSAGALQAALDSNPASDALPQRTQRWLAFVAKVSSASCAVSPSDVDDLRNDGWSDLEIAETIHMTALFAAFNRVVNAFGLSSQSLLTTLPPGLEERSA